MQTQTDIITQFLERKFRISRSYPTKNVYGAVIKKFLEFLSIQYNFDLPQMFHQILQTKGTDTLEILDQYYTFLSNYQTRNKTGYSSQAINQYIRVAKDLMNSQGCKIYNEDLRQKFRLPKRTSCYQKGLTKEAINRVIRFANPKLSTTVLMACSGGMRIGEIIQLKLSDVDFTAIPTTITIRAETAKTRETRLTHISSEATNALKDYLARYGPLNEYLFLQEHELKKADLSQEEKYSKEFDEFEYRFKEEMKYWHDRRNQ